MDGKVDLRMVSEGKVSMRSICKSIEVVPLDNVPGISALSGLSVTEERFLLQGDRRLILSYRRDGSLVGSLNPGKVIVDYSIFQDEFLDILSEREMNSYRLSDFAFIQRSALDTLVIRTRLARRSGNVMMLPGYCDGQDYLCEYHFDTKKLYNSPGMIVGERAQSVIEGTQFTRLGDKLLLFFPDSGRIWACDDFTYRFIWLDFIRRKQDKLDFQAVQVTEGKVYYSLLLNGEDHLLVFNRRDRKSLLLKTTQEGLSLPLGTIQEGINYFCCPASDVSHYLSRDLLDQKNADNLDAAIRNGKYVVLKYYLLAP